MGERTRNVVFSICGVLTVLGAALYLAAWQVSQYMFAVGAAGVAVCFLTQPTDGMTLRRRRLHRFNVVASLLMLAASYFMFKGKTEWILCLTIAAIFLLYSSFASGGDDK